MFFFVLLFSFYLQSVDVHTVQHFSIGVTADVDNQVIVIFECVYGVQKEEGFRHELDR
jgi:hypothetical protein